MDADANETVVVPLTQAPWFKTRNLTFNELSYLQEQRILCKRVTVDVMKSVGFNNFFYNGATLSSHQLPPDHVFYFAQWACYNIEKIVEVGLLPKTPQSLATIGIILGQLNTECHQLCEQLGIRSDKIIARLHSVREYAPPMIPLVPLVYLD